MSKLTPVQLRILRQLEDGEFHNAYDLCRQIGTRMKLTNNGFTEPECNRVITWFFSIRITNKGRSAIAKATKP